MPGIDGIDRTIKVCFPDITPVRLLMRWLIDGPVWTSLSRSGFWDEIHLPSFTYQSTWTGEWDYVGIVISLLFRVPCECIAGYLYILYMKNVNFCCQVGLSVCMCGRQKERISSS